MKNRIKELRQANNLTLKKLGNDLNISPDSLAKYERGERKPKIDKWQALASYFHVPISYIQGIEEKSTTSAVKNRIKWLREENDLNQIEFTDLFNKYIKSKDIKPVTRATVSRWENGLNNPTKRMWQALADYFNVSVPFLKGYIICDKCKKWFIPMPNTPMKNIKFCPYDGNRIIKGENK